MKAPPRKPTVAEQLSASAVYRVALDELAAADELDAAARPYARRGVVLDLSRSPADVRVFSFSPRIGD